MFSYLKRKRDQIEDEIILLEKLIRDKKKECEELNDALYREERREDVRENLRIEERENRWREGRGRLRWY